MEPTHRLTFVYDGWDGYQRSLVSAIAGLTAEQLAFRAAAEMRSVGELVWHVGAGRVDWFRRIDAPGAEALAIETPKTSAAELVDWLERTFAMVQATLEEWSVEDLAVTFEHEYWGNVYVVSRQWVVWRILTHDVHHGGQLSEILAMQGIFPSELTGLGGHLTEPPILRKA